MKRRCQVRCWVCGARRQRVAVSKIDIIGQRGRVTSYGPCPVVEGIGTLGPDDPGVPCRGVLLRRDDCLRVVRAAIRWERAGHNQMSEYDR